MIRGGSTAKIQDFPDLISQKVTAGRKTDEVMVKTVNPALE